MNTCRFCSCTEFQDEHQLDLIKYGVRHYGHPDCLLKAKGEQLFKELYTWQLEAFPYFAAKRAGLEGKLEDELELRHKHKTQMPSARLS